MTGTFRIFVSSTFSDLVAERNALQEHVFPRVRELCEAHGCRFQAIDLRWGVSEEAGLDQQTMKICLGEIERCRQVSPRPNFLILLGDRFGWRPLPAAIPAEEFERLLPALSADEAEAALWRPEQPDAKKGWYRRDDNATPAEYVLQPRLRGARCEDYVDWESEVERPLAAAFERAALGAGLAEAALVKYTHSATGQEIAAGALNVEDAPAHVFGFFRALENPADALASPQGRSFVEPDPELQRRQGDLKARLRERLPGNIYEHDVRWRGDGPSTAHIGALPATLAECLRLNDGGRAPANLCEAVWLRLSQVILAETSGLAVADPLQSEQEAHRAFGEERARLFVGREDLLARIGSYLAAGDGHPLAIAGASGSGKSALLARAVQPALTAAESAPGGHPAVIVRFIGATPASSDGRTLLEGLCRQITRACDGDASSIPVEYRDLVQDFPKRLALARPDKPLVLFLDALDQLADGDSARSLAWLPADLPPHVRLVVSTLPGACLAALQRRLPPASILSVPALSKTSGEHLLQSWLAEARRTLTAEQQADVLARFERSGGLPLYLRLACEEARHWHSYDGPPAHVTGPAGLRTDIPGAIHDFFGRLELESNHGRELVSHALGYLAAARHGLSEDELLDVLWQDGEVKAAFLKRSPRSPQEITALPVVIWARLYLDLAPYLAFRMADGAMLLTFYHRQVAEAVQERFAAGGEERNRRLPLAAYFAGQKLWLDEGHATPNARKTSELPHQQAHAGLSGELAATLTQFDFLRAMLEATNPQALADDVGRCLIPAAQLEAESAVSLGLVHKALVLAAHVLGHDKALLAGQLCGRLGGFSRPEIVRLLEGAGRWTNRPWLRPITPCLPPPGGALIRTLGAHAGWLEELRVTSDGRRAVSRSASELKVWDLETGTCERVHGDVSRDTAVAMSWSVAPYRIVTGASAWDDAAGKVLYGLEVSDLETGTCLTRLRGARKRVECVAITPDGSRVLSASYVYGAKDDTIDVWDVARVRCIRSIAFGAEGVLISPDGRRGVSIVAGEPPDGRGGLRIWNLDSGRCIRAVKDWQGSPTPILTPDGRRLFFLASQGRGVQIVDLESGRDLHLLSRGASQDIRAFSAAPNGAQVVTETAINSFLGQYLIQIWDVATGKPIRKTEGITRLRAILPGGRVGLDSRLRLWDLETGACLRELSSAPLQVERIAITPDGKRAVTTAESDPELRLWELEPLAGAAAAPAAAVMSRIIALLPGGREVVTTSDDTSLQLWDLATGAPLGELPIPIKGSPVPAFAATPDGRRLVCGSRAVAAQGASTWRDETVTIWYLPGGRLLHTLAPAGCSDVRLLRVSADGRRILCGWGAKLHQWDVGGEQPVRTELGSHSDISRQGRDQVNWIAITPDGRLGVSRSDWSEVLIWDLEQRCLAHELPGMPHSQPTPPPLIALLSDGRRLLTTAHDAATLWDVAAGERVREIRMTGRALAVTPNAPRLVVDHFSEILVYDLDTGSRDAIPRGSTVYSANTGQVSADGRRLLVRHDGGLSEVFDLQEGRKLAEFVGEGPHSGDAAFSGDAIMCLDDTGRAYFLALENVAPGAASQGNAE